MTPIHDYYKEGIKIGNYSIFRHVLVVDKDNRMLMYDESCSKDIYGFRDIIYCLSYRETEIHSAQDFSTITILAGKLICLRSLRDKYFIDYQKTPDEHDIRVLDSEFHEWHSPSFKGTITGYYVNEYDNCARYVLEFDHQYNDVYDENLVCLNSTTYPVAGYLDKDMVIVGTSDSFYCLYDTASKTCLQKDGREYHFEAYKHFDKERKLIAVREAGASIQVVHYKTLEPFFPESFDDIQPYGEGLFGASIHGVRGIYDAQLHLQFELPYERCLFPFKNGAACFLIREGDKQKKVAIDDKGHILFSIPSSYEVDDILKGGSFAMKYEEKHAEDNITKYKLWDASGKDLPNSSYDYDLYAYCQTGNDWIALTFIDDFDQHPPYCRIISEKGEIIKDNLTYDEMWEYIFKNGF